MAKLSDKQKRFAEEYIVDLNGKQAAIRAGYSENGADVQGHRLLANAKVAELVQKLQARRSERTEIDADSVLRELSRIGFSDLRGLFSEDGTALLPPSEWPDGLAHAVASIEVVAKERKEGRDAPIEYVHKVRLWPKNSALETIAKHLGMLVSKHEHSGPGGKPMEFVDVDARQQRINSIVDRIRARAGDG